jgi:REP element-mobilizing transposase RayT
LKDEAVRNALHAYIGGICRSLKCQPLGVGGPEDHAHVLVQFERTLTVSDLVRDIKGKSSVWAKPQVPDFAWQTGYGVFSFAKNQLADMQHYVNHQTEHHRQKSFAEEFLRLLKEHEVNYDERYLWE